MIVVSNASPLISLSKIEQLNLLHDLFGNIFITEQVFAEATKKGPGSKSISEAVWIKTINLKNPNLLQSWRSQYRLGIGELSTILLAKEQSADFAIIDERKARQLAQKEGIAIIGTIGILEEAYRRNFIKDLREIYKKLLNTGTYIAINLLNNSLKHFNLPMI